LIQRILRYSQKQPWKAAENCRVFIFTKVGLQANILVELHTQVQSNGTSTPFSCYSTFTSNRSEQTNKVAATAAQDFKKCTQTPRSGEMENQTKPNFFNIDQNELFQSKSKQSKLSKSVLSKSLSVLDKFKRAYQDLKDDTSRTLKRDVRLSDLIIPTPQ
jgi:hypothetical protein